MPETSPAQSTLQRLIEAEEQAQEIIRIARAKADESIVQAREQARQSVETVRLEGQGLLRAQLGEAESKGGAEMKRRMELAEAQSQIFQRRAQLNFSHAVEMVVNRILSGEEI
jgi:vacuolar-type H+-ATPase subunit H